MAEVEKEAIGVAEDKTCDYKLTWERNDYLTHPDMVKRILDKIGEKFFLLDVCCSYSNIPAVKRFVFGQNDGLKESWKTLKSKWAWAFCNPPFNECDKWVKKAYREQQEGNQSVLIIPARTETAYWRDYILSNENVEIDWLCKTDKWKFLNPDTNEEMGVFKNALAIVYFKVKEYYE